MYTVSGSVQTRVKFLETVCAEGLPTEWTPLRQGTRGNYSLDIPSSLHKKQLVFVLPLYVKGHHPFGAQSFAINSLAISLTCYPITSCYQLTCYQFTCCLFHLLSVSLALSLTCTQAILALATLAIRSICYQASLAIKTFAPQSQLLSMLIFYPKLVTIQIRCYENSSCVPK